jgi:PAS domain-containing protein
MRLAGQMVLAIFISLVLVEIAWLSVSYHNETARVPVHAEARIRLLLQAAVDPRTFPNLETERAVVERLTEVAHVVGACIEDTAGEPLAKIGQLPTMTVLEARRENISARVSPDRNFLDLYVPAEEIGFAHSMMLRVNLLPYYNNVLGLVLDTGLTVVNIVILTSTGLFLALYPILFQPLSRIRNAIMRGVGDLDIADTFMIKWNRKDELNDLAMAVNMLLAGASKNYNETLHTSHEVIANSPVAAIAYRSNGELSFANQSALELFGVGDVAELAKQDQSFLLLKGATHEQPITVESALVDGPFLDEGEVITPGGQRHMVCIGNITYRMDGTVRRYLAQFLDMDVAMPRIAQLAAHSDRATQRRIAAEQRAVRLRVMLESCLCLIDTDDETQNEDVSIVHADTIIITWARIYASVGKARRVLYNRLPQLSGHRKRLTMLFRQLLSYADFVSDYTDSELKVLAVTESNMVRFDITEVVPEDSTPKVQAERTGEGEITLCRGAIIHLVNQCGGVADLPESHDGTVKYSITIPKVLKETADGPGAETKDRDAA